MVSIGRWFLYTNSLHLIKAGLCAPLYVYSSPYERQQYQGGQEDEFFEDVVGEEDETQPKGDIFSRLGNREEGSTFQDPLDDGYTEGQGADSWFKVTVSCISHLPTTQ